MRGTGAAREDVRRLALLGVLVMAVAAMMAGRAAAGSVEAERGVAAGTLALRMSESMAWPDRFVATVRVEPVSGADDVEPVSFRLVGFAPDTFRWEPQGDRGIGGTAWRGYLQLDVRGPGPRFAYGYGGFPFLQALEVYFAIFRPLPETSRLVLGQSVRVLNRQAVEAVLFDAEEGRRAQLVVDVETGLILQASVAPAGQGRPGAGTLVRAVRFDVGAAVASVEYEAPVLGERGRLVLTRRGRSWFPAEAVVGDGAQTHRVRFDQLQLGEAAGDLRRPDVSTLERLAQALEQAEEGVRAKRWQEAVERARVAVAIDPYNVQAHNLLGYAAMEMGDWVTAASAYDQIIQLAPDSPLGYNNLAYLYTEMGLSLSRALALARKAVELSGDEPDAAVLDTYGWALFHNGHLEEAREMLERAVAALGDDDPESQAEVLYHLGVVHARMERFDEARQLFTRALELDPDLAEAKEALSRLPGGGSPQTSASGTQT